MTEIILDLLPPPSVNRTRKMNWAAQPKIQAWKDAVDKLLLAAWSGGKRPKPITGKFEATIILSETATGIDLDNAPKQVLDMAKRLGLIVDDGKKYMRRVVIEWGEAEEGCRLILKSVE